MVSIGNVIFTPPFDRSGNAVLWFPMESATFGGAFDPRDENDKSQRRHWSLYCMWSAWAHIIHRLIPSPDETISPPEHVS